MRAVFLPSSTRIPVGAVATRVPVERKAVPQSGSRLAATTAPTLVWVLWCRRWPCRRRRQRNRSFSGTNRAISMRSRVCRVRERPDLCQAGHIIGGATPGAPPDDDILADAHHYGCAARRGCVRHVRWGSINLDVSISPGRPLAGSCPTREARRPTRNERRLPCCDDCPFRVPSPTVL